MTDKVCYSNNGLSFHWVPANYIAHEGEVLFAGIASADDLNRAFPGYSIAVAKENIMHQILLLEATITPRRMREAVLGVDSGWMAGVNTQIAVLRAQL